MFYRTALTIQYRPHRKLRGPGTEMDPGQEVGWVGSGRYPPCSRAFSLPPDSWLRCGHSLSSHSCLQGTVTRQAVEMSQELPVRNGTQSVRSRELGPPAGPVADPVLLPGNSPGPNHPLQAHILGQLDNSVSCTCLWCRLVDICGISLARFPRDVLEVSLPQTEIQCTTI